MKNKYKKGFFKVLYQERSHTKQHNTSVSISNVTGKCALQKSYNSELHNSKPYFLDPKPCGINEVLLNSMMMIIIIWNSALKKTKKKKSVLV
jgi:hypothetical protein